ncbi:hypothetical protein LSH36_31g01010 [Paralvinella palmiformis]|uniref:Uncharacterized protein n=1 Tax=Paralvinella palmiformis TaxID=53620 RepID=A0AAD9NFZ3_9ANNE|nr:hypothetical protein LSH36_31g01010 [Paralvinella palmiformis]
MAALIRVSRLLGTTVSRRLLHSTTNYLPKVAVLEQLGAKYIRKQGSIPTFLTRHLCTAASSQPVQDNENQRRTRRQTSSDASFDFGPIFERFQRNLSSYKRIKPGQVIRLLDLVRKRGSIPPFEASQIIRATGALLVRESPERRRQVFQQVHETLQQLVKNPDIVYYNSVLKTRLENEDFFDPAVILTEVEDNSKLKANRETYQILIEAYCLQGDVAGATKILEHMKSAGIPISENVFHSMIKGYMKQGDNENAVAVLDLMKEANLQPVQATYTTLMCGFAEQGDHAQIKKIQSEAEYDDVILQPRHLFSVLFILGRNGHNTAFSQMLQEMTAKFSEVVPYNNEALNCSFRLMANSKDEEALQVFRSIRQFPDEQYKRNLTLNFIDAMVIQDKPYDEIVDMMDQFVTSGHLKTEDINTVAHLAVDNRKRELANRAFLVLMEKGESLSSDDVYEMIRIKKEMNDVSGIMEVMNLGQQVTGTKQDRTAEIYLFSFDAMKQLGRSPDQIFDDMKERGFKESAVEHYKLLHAVSTGKYDEAKDYLEKLEKDRILPMSFPLLYRGLKESEYNIDGFSEVLALLKRRVMPMQHLRAICTGVMGKMLNENISSETAESLVRKYLELDLAPLPWNSGRMKTELTAKGVDEKTVEELVSRLDSLVEELKKPAENLDRKAIDEISKKLEQDPDSVPLKYLNIAELNLLRKYCFSGQTEKAETLKERMENRGFHFSRREQIMLCLFYLDQKGDVEKAKEYIRLLSMTSDMLPPRIPVSMAHHYLKIGNPNEAIDVLKKYNARPDSTKNLQGRVMSFLMDVKKMHPQLLQEAAQTVMDKGYLSQMSPVVANVFVDNALESKDPDEIIKTCEQLKTQMGWIPKFPEVLKFFVEQEDPKRLQRVVDMLTEVRDELEIHHHLAVAFMECNRLAQAKKIMQSAGMKANQAVISVVCRQLTNKNMEEVLRQYIQLVREVPGCDLDEAFFHLIRFYSVMNEAQKALDVLEMYKEAGIQPRGRTLRYLAKVLQSEKIEVPFKIPTEETPRRQPRQVSKVSSERRQPGDTDKLEKAERNMIVGMQADKNVPEFLKKLKEMNNGDPVEMGKSLHRILEDLMTRQEERFGKSIIWHLGDNGEVEVLSTVQDLVPKRLHQAVHRGLVLAYFKSGRKDELVKLLESSDISIDDLVSTPILLYVDSDPDVFNKFVSVIEQREYSSEQKDLPRDSLLAYYLIKMNFDKAEQMLEQYPNIAKQTNLLYIYTNVINKYGMGPQVEQLVDFMIDRLTENNPVGRKYIMGKWLDTNVNSGNMEQALKVLENLKQRGATTTDLFFKNLRAIKQWLTNEGKSVPWKDEEYEEAERIEQENQSKRVMRRTRSVQSDSD